MSIFSDVKENVSIEQAANYLGLKQMKPEKNGERRYRCPVCETKDPDPLCIGFVDGKFTCYGTGKKPNGDLIALTAHVKSISQTEAAKLLAKHFLASSANRATEPRHESAEAKGRSEVPQKDFRPLEFHQWEHPVMDMLNLSPAVLQAIGGGIGHEDELKDRICIPLRTPEGKLIGYQGIATRSDMSPLVIFWPENIEERVKPEKREPDEMRKILRLVS